MNFTILVVLLYNFGLLSGTAWLVAIHDWSPWWFLLTITLMSNKQNNFHDCNK
jgi:hypothetical protein